MYCSRLFYNPEEFRLTGQAVPGTVSSVLGISRTSQRVQSYAFKVVTANIIWSGCIPKQERILCFPSYRIVGGQFSNYYTDSISPISTPPKGVFIHHLVKILKDHNDNCMAVQIVFFGENHHTVLPVVSNMNMSSTHSIVSIDSIVRHKSTTTSTVQGAPAFESSGNQVGMRHRHQPALSSTRGLT